MSEFYDELGVYQAFCYASYGPWDDTPEGRAARYREVWQQNGPKRFRAANVATLDEPTRATVTDWISRVIKGEAGNLLIFGPVGTGKTWAAMAVLRALMEREYFGHWWSMVDLLDALRPGGSLEMADVGWPGVVLLDDLGGERPTDWVLERIYGIVNARWMSEKPLIVTSNLEPEELREVIAARTFDRLRDGATAIEITGKSRRGR